MAYAKKRKNLVEEPCTLVYTLFDSSCLNFDDFYLLIRGLHTYMVEEITPFADKNSVHVRLGYQASVDNATKKMGNLTKYVSLSKMSNFVKESEINKLQQLRQRFNILGASGYDDAPEPSTARAWQQPPTQQKGRYKNPFAPVEEI